jgi:hypothetical protein
MSITETPTQQAPLRTDAAQADAGAHTFLLSATLRRVLLLSLTLAGFGWRCHGLANQSLWRDEVDAIYFALRDLPETLAMAVQPGQNGVLYFLMLRPWLQSAGSSEFALRFPSVLFGVLAVPLLWQVARKLIPGRSGGSMTLAMERIAPRFPLDRELPPLVAALLLAVNPYQLWYSQEGKMYTLVTALALLATWYWLRGIGPGGWRPWLAYLVTVTVAIYSHLLMILLLPLHLLWFLIAWPQSRRHWRGYGLALAGLTLPYLPMVIWQWDMLTRPEQQTGFRFTPLPDMLERILMSHARGFTAAGEGLWLAPLYFLGLAGIFLGWLEIGRPLPDEHPRLAGWRRFLLVTSWLLAPMAMIYAMSLREPIFTVRYIIWIAPAAMMALALGVQLVWRNAGILRLPLTGLLLAYLVGFWSYAGWQQKTTTIKYDLRSAVTAIAAQRDPTDELLILQIPHMEYAYRYYSSDQGPDPFAEGDARLGWWGQGLWTNSDLTDDAAREDVDRQMGYMTAGAQDVWVLRSEVEMWDSRYLMDAWLDQNAELVERQGFHGAEVRHYRFTD